MVTDILNRFPEFFADYFIYSNNFKYQKIPTPIDFNGAKFALKNTFYAFIIKNVPYV